MAVRPAERSDVEPLARALAAAFTVDPFSRWLFGSDERLEDRLRASFELQLRVVSLRRKHTYTTHDRAGAALWAPPGRWRLSAWEQMRMAVPYLRLLGAQRIARAGPAHRLIERAHPSEPHWHLVVLGVEPSRQRAGVGAALLADGIRRAETDGVPAYLETSRPENVAYYASHGFEVASELDLPGDGPRMWTMIRHPRAVRG